MFLTLMASIALFTALAALAWIDARTYRLPDWLTLPLIVLGLVVNAGLWGSVWAPIAGAAIGYVSLVVIEHGYRALRGRDGLGRGDAKLMAAGGAWCGAWMLPLIVLIASLSAIVFILAISAVRRRLPDSAQPWPFGPWIALAIGVAWSIRVYDTPLPLVF
ncbi:prepilin peptidase [Maricaulis sp. CAU 1757]